MRSMQARGSFVAARHRRRSLRRSPAPGDDGLSFAGWMYADVLLALFVVALAAVPIASAAAGDGTVTPTSTTTTAPTTVAPVPSTTTPPPEWCDSVSVNDAFEIRIPADENFIDQFQLAYAAALEQRGLAPDQQVGFALAFRGPDIGVGTREARRSMSELSAALPQIFGRSAWRGYGDRQLGANEIRLEVFPLISAAC